MTAFMMFTDAEEAAVRELQARKTFKTEAALDSYLVACYLNHLRAPRSAYRAGAKPSPLATAGAKVQNNQKVYAETWEAAACSRAESRRGA